MSSPTVSVTLVCLVFFQGCKIEQSAGRGGSIISMSGEHDCAEDRICVVELPAGEGFREEFTAVPRQGYAFAGWGDARSGLCSDQRERCLVEIPASATGVDGTLYLIANFYHRPELVEAGTLSMEYDVWKKEVNYESIGFRFSGDFDGDGDDDVLIAGDGAVYPSDSVAPTIVAHQGAILLNDGDFTFSVAEGDRPSGVHPREVLLADFNGDGKNDLFIADHGYDADPFPGWSNQLLLATGDGV